MTKQKPTQYLKCTLTDAEVSDLAKELAASNRRRSSIEQQKKEIDSDLKSKIEAENTKIGRLSEQIALGFEYRDIEVSVMLDSPRPGMKTVIRLDTGEEVKVEPMTDDDRQMALKLEEDAAAAEPKVDLVPETHRLEESNGTVHGEGFTVIDAVLAE